MNQEHIMIDIETLGVNPGCAILSIAAVKFDIETGMIIKAFYENIDLKSCLLNGLDTEADTINWWMRQSDEARRLVMENPIHINKALLSLNAFIGQNSIVWGNSARFDLGILVEAYNRASLPVPWQHRNERCLRTIVSLNPEFRDNEEFLGTPHYAVDDCMHQVKYLVKILKSLTLNKFVS